VITLTQAAESTELVQFQVLATLDGATYNPASDPVSVAFLPVASPLPSAPAPSSGEWNAASWETDSGPIFWASILVGPLNGGVALTAGGYVCFVMVTATPYAPIRPGAFLIIT
jgi:hypothetical protein